MGKTNGYWKRHPRKELQALLAALSSQGWRVKDPPTYYKVLCPCEQQHWETVHLTPSNPMYLLNKTKQLERGGCFDSKKGGK